MAKEKGKTYIFVDSENVGNLIPGSLPKKTEVYFFLSDVNVYRKVYALLDDKHFHVVDLLEQESARKREKNEMDLAIIAFMGNLIQNGVKKKDAYIILSFDKGYDRAVHLLKQENPKLNVRREEMSLRQLIDGQADPRPGSVFKGALPKNALIRKKACEADNWDVFRKSLNMSQRKSLRQNMQTNPETGASTWFEYNFYDGSYLLYSSGTQTGSYESMEAGKEAYDRFLEKPKKKRKKPGRSRNIKPKLPLA